MGKIGERERELNEFESTKAGVKGLVDTGITKVPHFFILPPEHRATPIAIASPIQIPTVDLEGSEGQRRGEVVNEIGEASKAWGMLYMTNHGVPMEAMRNVLEGTRAFHEQPNDVKREVCTRDPAKKVQYCSSFQRVLNAYLWKDSFSCELEDLDTTELPLVCREAICAYVKHMIKLKDRLCALLSEAMGLGGDHLRSMRCMEAQRVFGHYYPPCPEPHLTMGTTIHSDPFFLTILLTNNVDGLQVLHQNQWVQVPHMEGALICNIGDMLQLVSNGLFKSAEHRVVARSVGLRMSVGCFFYPSSRNKEQKYGAIKELLSESNPPVYKEISFHDYFTYFQSKRTVGTKALLQFMQ